MERIVWEASSLNGPEYLPGGSWLNAQLPGARDYRLTCRVPETDNPAVNRCDVLITISVFGSANQALASNEKAADWVRNNALEFTNGTPEVMVGNVLIAEVK